MLNLEEIEETRPFMLGVFLEEKRKGELDPSKVMTESGKAAFPDHMEKAIRSGNEVTLAKALNVPGYWTEKARDDHPEMLANSEFSTYYVKALALRLHEEGEEYCEIYRAAAPRTGESKCPLTPREGAKVKIQDVLDGYRAYLSKQRGEIISPTAERIPAQPWCHHSIRRVK